MRRLPIVLPMTLALLLSGAALAKPTTIAVFGDAPYGISPTDMAQVAATPAFVQAVNADAAVSLVIHVGDIHSGKSYCTAEYDKTIYGLWKAFNKPLVFTPGDNEWTDCHKQKEGGGVYNTATGQIDYVLDARGNPVDYAAGNPLANLALVRSIFFARTGHSLGVDRTLISQQAQYDRRHPEDAAFIENVYFIEGDVLFVTVNIPGGSNNDQDIWYDAPVMSAEQAAEIPVRTAATVRWLEEAFRVAKTRHAKAVVVATQADMWDLDGHSADHLTGYEPIIEAVARQTASFKRPVLMIAGDSHVYRSDNPLVAGAPCVTEGATAGTTAACASDDWANHPSYNVPNFHRVVVHGSTSPLEYLRLTIDTEKKVAVSDTSFGPFSWTRVNP